MAWCQVKGGLVCRQLNSKSSIKHFVFFKSVCAPEVWSSLPITLKENNSKQPQFNKNLKTYLFSEN